MYFVLYFFILFVIVFFSFLFYLQYIMSKKKNKFLGLIIPAFTLVFVVFILISFGLERDVYIVLTNKGEKYTFENIQDANNKAEFLIELNEDVQVSSDLSKKYNATTIFINMSPILIMLIISVAIYLYAKLKK